MTREEIIAKFKLSAEFEKRGVKLIRAGNDKWKCKCPFHDDGSPSCEIDDNKGLWNCFGCNTGGTIIDAFSRFDGCSPVDAMKKLGGIELSQDRQQAAPTAKIVKVYQYHYEDGSDAYQVCRLEPKSFRQRHKTADGKWVWSMEGVKRVLYRITEVAKAETVWLVEGEKDADNLAALGFCSTCNVGGAGKWLDAYTESLASKKLVLCGDSDKPGIDHIKKVSESVQGKVASTRTIKLPEGFKDVSDYLASFPPDATEAKQAAINAIYTAAPELHRGIDLQIFSMEDMENDYINHVTRLKDETLHLHHWLPSMACVRGLVPGELVVFLADTGVGKTAVLQNLAFNVKLPTLMFEMELPTTLLFERFVAIQTELSQSEVETAYNKVRTKMVGVECFMPNFFCCPKSGLTMEQIRKTIEMAELKMGQQPKLILIDYVQLVQGRGNSRYERTSTVAEDLKILAKETKTIVVIASQVSRKKDDDAKEINLHDAKDSGSIENSSGLVIGLWKEKDRNTLKMKVLKNTKGIAGHIITCNFNGQNMKITERSEMPDFDHE